MKEYEVKDVSFTEGIKQIHDEATKILDDFCKAYLAETKVMPSEIKLMKRETKQNNEVIVEYWFRLKDENE